MPAGVHRLSISLHNTLPSNLDLCEGCPCSGHYFVADPLLNGPDLFSRLLPAHGFSVMQRALSQMRLVGGQGVDLVLGLHAGIEDSRLMIFLRSLRSSCIDCFIVLFCREISSNAQRILIQTRAWCIQYDFWLANSTLGPAGDHRFAIYSNFLALAGSSVRRVFLSDVRDVAFQGSPFDSLQLEPLDVVFFLEDKRRLIQVTRLCIHQILPSFLMCLCSRTHGPTITGSLKTAVNTSCILSFNASSRIRALAVELRWAVHRACADIAWP
jgi:hypothetical protein